MRILVFGDSIAQGFVDEERGGWCNQLVVDSHKQRAEDGRDEGRVVVNLAVSGDTTTDLLARVQVEAKARIKDINDVVVLAIGANDSRYVMATRENAVLLSDTIRNLLKIRELLAELVNQVVVIGLLPVYEPRIQPIAWRPDEAYSNAEVSRYNGAIREFAEERKLPFIDVADVYEGREEELLPDGIHPNAEGHYLIYKRIKTALQKVDILLR
jgi:acyl-CoA thioesterase-1